MYLELQEAARRRVFAMCSKQSTNSTVENIPLETPPELKFGELATPIAFELARKLRKAPEGDRAGDCCGAGRGGGVCRI